MAQILVRAVDNALPPQPDPLDPYYDDHLYLYNKALDMVWKKGYPVIVRPDDHEWGAKECLPNFVVLKIPGMDVKKLKKYTEEVQERKDVTTGNGEVIKGLKKKKLKRRKWTIRWDDLPLQAQEKLLRDGELIISAGSYHGPYDYKWAQLKKYFRDQVTGNNETEDL